LYELNSYDYKENDGDLLIEKEIGPLEEVIYYKEFRGERGEGEE